MNEKPDCLFQARFLPPLVQFCGSPKDNRDWVKGVSIDPMPGGRGIHMIASNSKCLVVVRDMMGYAAQPMVLGFHASFVTEIKKLVKADQQVVSVGVEGGQSWGCDANRTILARNVITRYEPKPAPWRNMVAGVLNAPQTQSDLITGFEFDGIKKFNEFVDFTSPYAAPHHISIKKMGVGFVIRSASLTDAFGVVLGTQHPALPVGLPDWGEVAIGLRRAPPLAAPVLSDAAPA